MANSPKTRRLPERRLPVPATASAELQKACAQPLDAAIEIIEREPQDLDDWRKTLALYDQASRLRLEKLRQRFPVQSRAETLNGVTVYRLTPPQIAPENRGRRLVHFHGGGFALAGGELGTGEGILAAYRGQIEVFSADYRQCPDHPYPAPLEDALAVWQALAGEFAPQNLGLIGASAGGNLILALVFKLQELGLPLPAALACCSPWADLLARGDTINTLQYVDSAAISYTGLITGMAKLYGGAGDWRDPLISPVYGDFTGFPPTLLISGARDLFLSDTVRVHRQLRRRGAWADLQVFEGLSHAEHLYLFDSPESEEVFGEIRRFFERFLGK